MSKRGFSLMEIVLSLAMAGLLFLTVSSLYEFQAQRFSKVMSKYRMLDDARVTIASLKRYEVLATNVLTCASDELQLKINDHGNVKKVCWVIEGGELVYGEVDLSQPTILDGTLLAQDVAKDSRFVCSNEPKGTVVGLFLHLVDKYGQEVKRICKFLLPEGLE